MLLPGHTHTNDDTDLSMEALTNDAIALINTIYGDNYPPAIILVGHRCLILCSLWSYFKASSSNLSALLCSALFFIQNYSLGGSVAVHVAISGQIRELIGLIVLDVVEGRPFVFLFLNSLLWTFWLTNFLRYCHCVTQNDGSLFSKGAKCFPFIEESYTVGVHLLFFLTHINRLS